VVQAIIQASDSDKITSSIMHTKMAGEREPLQCSRRLYQQSSLVSTTWPINFDPLENHSNQFVPTNALTLTMDRLLTWPSLCLPFLPDPNIQDKFSEKMLSSYATKGR